MQKVVLPAPAGPITRTPNFDIVKGVFFAAGVYTKMRGTSR